MSARRRLVLRGLITALAALGWPAAVAAQPAVALPLRDARELVAVDAWEGYSPVSPTRATYRLRRTADGSFAGTVEMSVGAGLIRRDTSFAIHLPRAAADSLLQVLSDAPLREESYRPTFTHTDDFPAKLVDVTVGDSVIRFHTRSQGRWHEPWQVSAGGKTYVTGSEAIWSALSAVLGRMGGREMRGLVDAAQNDPEAHCAHNRRAAEPQPTRPRYAANEAWFTADSSITVQGRAYRKLGLPRVVGLYEISPYATYRGVTVSREAGLDGTPEVIYVPVHASCQVQPYEIQPRP